MTKPSFPDPAAALDIGTSSLESGIHWRATPDMTGISWKRRELNQHRRFSIDFQSLLSWQAPRVQPRAKAAEAWSNVDVCAYSRYFKGFLAHFWECDINLNIIVLSGRISDTQHAIVAMRLHSFGRFCKHLWETSMKVTARSQRCSHVQRPHNHRLPLGLYLFTWQVETTKKSQLAKHSFANTRTFAWNCTRPLPSCSLKTLPFMPSQVLSNQQLNSNMTRVDNISGTGVGECWKQKPTDLFCRLLLCNLVRKQQRQRANIIESDTVWIVTSSS